MNSHSGAYSFQPRLPVVVAVPPLVVAMAPFVPVAIAPVKADGRRLIILIGLVILPLLFAEDMTIIAIPVTFDQPAAIAVAVALIKPLVGAGARGMKCQSAKSRNSKHHNPGEFA